MEGLLSRDAAKRWTAKRALKHKLFSTISNNINDLSHSFIGENLTFKPTEKRRRLNVIKRGMLLFIATRLLPENRYMELNQLFTALDVQGDGYLTQDSLKNYLKNEFGENA